MGKQWKQCQTFFFFFGSKITADGDCSHETKRHFLRGRKIMTNLDSIFKSRDITLPTRLWFFQWSCMDVRVGLWRKLSAEELMLWPVVLEKTLESPLDCKDIQPVHSKGDQSWVFIGRTDTKAESPILWPLHEKSWLIGKDSNAGRDWGHRKREWQRMRWLDGITGSMDMTLSELWKLVMGMKAWRAAIHGITKSRTRLSDFHFLSYWIGPRESQGPGFLSSVQSLSCVRLFATPWTCPSPTPGVHPNSCAQSWWCHPTISSSVIPFSSCPQSLPASESFPVSQLFAWGGQRIGVSASASVLPMYTQDWSPSEWTGWISLQSKGLSRVFSNTTGQSINSSALSFLHSPTLTSIHDHWKNHSLD